MVYAYLRMLYGIYFISIFLGGARLCLVWFLHKYYIGFKGFKDFIIDLVLLLFWPLLFLDHNLLERLLNAILNNKKGELK